MRKLVVAAVGVVATLGVSGGTALAAPSNSPRAQEFTLDCGTAGTFTVVAPPGGNSMQSKSTTPAIIVGNGSGVLIPTSLTFTFPGLGSFSVSRGLGNPKANAVQCSATLPNGATVDATGFKTP